MGAGSFRSAWIPFEKPYTKPPLVLAVVTSITGYYAGEPRPSVTVAAENNRFQYVISNPNPRIYVCGLNWIAMPN